MTNDSNPSPSSIEKDYDMGKRYEENSSLKKPIIIALVAFPLSIALAFATAYLLLPWMKNNEAKKYLASTSSSAVTTINSQQAGMSAVKGEEKIPNTNTKQSALTVNGKITSPASFLFGGGGETGRKNVDIYLDLNSQRSRDFLLMNRNTLTSLTSSKTITTNIHVVPNGKALNLLSGEALAEVAVTSPDRAWPFLLEAAKMASTSTQDDSEAISNSLATMAKELEVSKVDANSIRNGTFSSWLLTAGKDLRLRGSFNYPLVFVDNIHVDPNTVNLNDADEFRKVVLQ